jgi:hypothetical protein
LIPRRIKERKTIVEKKRKKKKERNRVDKFVYGNKGLLWDYLCLSFKEFGLRAAKLNPSSLEKQRRSSQRLPCFFMPKEIGKGCVTGNLFGF